MKRKSVLILAGCLCALTLQAEESPTQAPQAASLDLPTLEQPNSKKSLPDSVGLPKNNSVILPDASIPSRPQPSTTGTANKDKDWLVNGLLEAQKKQQEDQTKLKQKQQQENNLYIQQEYERQQKILMGNNNNPLDNTKNKLGLSNSGSNGLSSSGTSASSFNLPNGRLNVSGSKPNSIAPVNLSGLPELNNPNNNSLPGSNGDNNAPYASSSNPYGYNPSFPANNSLPNNSSNSNFPRNYTSPLNNQNPAQTNNLIPQAPTAYSLDQQPALPNTPYSNPNSTPGQNNPFTSAQAANVLKQMDNNKSAPNPNRPTMQDLSNGIPNPADMRRF